MVTQLQSHQQASDIEVTIGDFATTTVAGRFRLVSLLRNTITNLTTQDEQVQAFRNAAAHLEPGGRFVIKNSSGAPTPPAWRDDPCLQSDTDAPGLGGV